MPDLHQLHEIFDVVADLEDDAARREKLDQLCGSNSALRAEVEALLEAAERAGSFLSEPEISPDDTHVSANTGLEEGAIIGKYRLLEQIGEGANAVVYMVEQIETLRRRAALKVIKLGMDTREVIARFETERQALAIMDHPNIAKVLDAGATEAGRPYFVMELVKGIPITDYCDRNKLAMRERLEIFIVVCGALQHAHLKGLIHRDVKPSNVLVTLHDGVPVPKVIDFGIAKATESRLTDRTLFTRFHQFIGTPAYMSPEQAEMSGLDIDTRSDIYSLGVLLYELLTGSTPFDGKKLLESGYSEIQRTIREREPEAPSTRLGTLSAEGLTAVSNRRNIQPGELSGDIRGDLDWIVMKALEKDRTRRYETAGELMRDVRRHLDNEPVEAGPPSKIYRIKKFVLRHKPAVIAASIVTISLVAALLIASFGLVQARRDAAAARRQAEKADTVTQLLDEMFQSATPGAAKRRDFTVRELLDDFSARFAGGLASEPEVEMTLMRTVGIAYEGLGEYLRAERHLRRARDLAQQLYGTGSVEALEIDARIGWLTHELENSQSAIAILEAVASGQEEAVGINHPDYLQTLAYLAATKFAFGETDEAEALANQVVAAPPRDGNPDPLWMAQIRMEIYRAQGKHDEAEKLSASLLDMIEKSSQGGLEPRTIEALHTAVQGQILHGQLDEAEELIRRGLQTARRTLSDDHRMTLLLVRDLGKVAQARGDKLKAGKIYAGVLEDQVRTLSDEHADTIQTRLTLVGLRLDMHQDDLAETIAQEAYDSASRKFGEEDELTIDSVCELAKVFMQQGLYKKARTILEHSYKLARREHGDPHATTINCARQLGLLHGKQENWTAAEGYSREVLKACRATLRPESEETLQALENLSIVLENMFRHKEAQELSAEMLELRGSIQDQRRHANLFRKRKIPAPAVELLNQAFAASLETNEPGARETLEIMRDQTEAYGAFDDDVKALAIATEGVRLANTALGKTDKLTRWLESVRSSLTKTRSRWTKSEEDAKAAYERLLANGGDVTRAWDHWILYLTAVQDVDASTHQVEKFLAQMRNAHGDDHVDTLRARHAQAWHARRCFDAERADRLYRELIDDEARLLEPLHQLRQKTLYSYAEFLIGHDRHEEADALLDSWQDGITESDWDDTEILIPRHSRWRFLNFERDEASAWKEFGDETVPIATGSRWQTGVAPFGYGIAGIATEPWLVTGHPSNTTLHFRRTFEVSDPSKYSALKVRLRRDGGAAVYLNGEEVVRDKLVEGAAYNTTSEEVSKLSHFASYVFIIDPGTLREGQNIVAVEVHQETLGSTDMAFDLELSGKFKQDSPE